MSYLRGTARCDRGLVHTQRQVLQALAGGGPELLHQVGQWEELQVLHTNQSQGLEPLTGLMSHPLEDTTTTRRLRDANCIVAKPRPASHEFGRVA